MYFLLLLSFPPPDGIVIQLIHLFIDCLLLLSFLPPDGIVILFIDLLLWLSSPI